MASYSDATLRGLLLEEAILFILSKTGYSPIFKKNSDSSLCDGKSGLEVLGRGANHQIDAVADFQLTPPFCNPQRLLIEAKFKANKTGLDVVRNATGVHKDVSEHWVIEDLPSLKAARKRFHYLYAIFSKEPFTKAAQDFAYAQDIFLLPLKRNSLFSPIIDAIDAISFERIRDKPRLSTIRTFVRDNLFGTKAVSDIESSSKVTASLSQEFLLSIFANLITTTHERGFGFITMFDGKFPVFLSATRSLATFEFEDENMVFIRVENDAWFIEAQNGTRLFSFDLPEEIFEKYQKCGSLSPRQLLEIKTNHMSKFYVFVCQNESLKLLRFKLDEHWIESISQEIERK